MRLKLGSVNLALLSIYFVPVWGRDAVRALVSPYNGLGRSRACGGRDLFPPDCSTSDTNGLVLDARTCWPASSW